MEYLAETIGQLIWVVGVDNRNRQALGQRFHQPVRLFQPEGLRRGRQRTIIALRHGPATPATVFYGRGGAGAGDTLSSWPTLSTYSVSRLRCPSLNGLARIPGWGAGQNAR